MWDKRYKHGMSYTPEYRAYSEMKRRCLDNKRQRYKDYGGRGIKICKRWLENFENFYKDMGEKPSTKHSLDRIYNNKGYSKNNCRWATEEEQANNTRGNKRIKYLGRVQSLSLWCKELRLPYRRTLSRLEREKMSPRKAFSKDKLYRRNSRYFTYKGKKKTVTELCKELKLSSNMVFARLFRGWPIKESLEYPKGKTYNKKRNK